MVEFVLFMIFGVIETLSIFFLAFKVFKIDIYLKEMIFAGIVMNFFSYVIRVDYSWIEMDIVVQYLLLFCFFWLLFKIHPFFSAILTGMIYQGYTFIQFIYMLIMNYYGLFSSTTPYGKNIDSYVLQLLSAMTTIIIGMYIGRKRKGFDFVPDKPNGKIKISKKEKFLFILNLPTVVVALSILHFFNTKFMFLIPLTYSVILFCYVYLSYKKDRTQHEHIKL